MAKIIADKGHTRVSDSDGNIYFAYVYEMDCGCEIRVDQRTMAMDSRSSSVDLAGRLARVAEAHDCEVVVHHAPEQRRREVRQRRPWLNPGPGEAGITYMGIDLTTEYQNTFAQWMRDTPPRASVRAAAERLRGLQASGTGPAPRPVESKLPDPSKKEEPVKLDRFQLLDLD